MKWLDNAITALCVIAVVALVVIVAWTGLHRESPAVAYDRGKAEGIEIGKNFHAIDALVRTIEGDCYQYLGWNDGHMVRNMDTLVIRRVQTEPLTEVTACGVEE